MSTQALFMDIRETVAELVHVQLEEGTLRTADPEETTYESRQRDVETAITSLANGVLQMLISKGYVQPPVARPVPQGNADPKLFGQFHGGFEEGRPESAPPPRDGETYEQLQLPGMED